MEGVVHVVLDRPARGNAIDAAAARAIIAQFRQIRKSRLSRKSKTARLVLLSGSGKDFCTGADLSWMARSRSLSAAANRADALILAELYGAILECEIPVLGKIHGRALGGGVGLAAACDIAACTKDTVFRLPEAGLGLVPGTLTPVLIRKIGYSRFLDLAMTGRELSSSEALEAGLVAFRGPARAVDRYLSGCAGRILAGAPESIREIKAAAARFSAISARDLREMALATARARVGAVARERVPE